MIIVGCACETQRRDPDDTTGPAAMLHCMLAAGDGDGVKHGWSHCTLHSLSWLSHVQCSGPAPVSNYIYLIITLHPLHSTFYMHLLWQTSYQDSSWLLLKWSNLCDVRQERQVLLNPKVLSSIYQHIEFHRSTEYIEISIKLVLTQYAGQG